MPVKLPPELLVRITQHVKQPRVQRSDMRWEMELQVRAEQSALQALMRVCKVCTSRYQLIGMTQVDLTDYRLFMDLVNCKFTRTAGQPMPNDSSQASDPVIPTT